MREYLAHLEQNDVGAMRDFFGEDVVWHVGGNHGLSGDYHGRDALLEHYSRARELTGGTLTLSPESILASNKYTAMFVRVNGQRNGTSLDVLMAQIFKVGPDGRWAEY